MTIRLLPFRASASSLAFAAVLLAGCAAGPDFETPAAPDVTAYDSAATPAATEDGAQKFIMTASLPNQWWRLFHASALNTLITRALAANPDIAAADAALRAAEASLAAEQTSFLPSVSGSFSSTRQQASEISNGSKTSIYTLHNASISASYTLDLFGGTRRSVEKAQAQADAARFQKQAADLTLTGNVVTAAVQEASLREQLAAAQAIIDKRARLVALLKARFDAGAVARSAVIEQEQALATARAALPALKHQLSVQRHLLSTLAGDLPQKAPEASFRLADLTLPTDIPLSLPAQLTAQRPDIRVAEENLHAASAAIGVAQAARLPQITLSADLGSMAFELGKLFSPGGGFWALSAGAAQSLFDAGAAADREDAARATFDQAAATYRGTVLTAYRNVADALHAVQADAETVAATTDARKAATESLSLAQARFSSGATDASSLLTAEIADLSAASDLAKAQAQRLADTAALLVALGGGWWNRDAETGLIIGSDTLVSPEILISAKGASHD